MRHAHVFAILLLALLVAAAGSASPALAQSQVKPRLRPQVPPPAGTVEPAPPAPAAATAAQLTLQGLPRRFDAAPACRSRCTQTRAMCESVDDACAPAWTACLRRCAAT